MERLFEYCSKLRKDKEEVYGKDTIDKIAELSGLSPKRVCYVLQAKHFVALGRLLDSDADPSTVSQFIVDIINYQQILHELVWRDSA